MCTCGQTRACKFQKVDPKIEKDIEVNDYGHFVFMRANAFFEHSPMIELREPVGYSYALAKMLCILTVVCAPPARALYGHFVYDEMALGGLAVARHHTWVPCLGGPCLPQHFGPASRQAAMAHKA